MFHVRLLLFFAALLTLLSLVASITVSFVDILPGLILMWIIYGLFIRFSSYRKVNFSGIEIPLVSDGANRLIIVVTVAYLVFFPIYIQFYTGSSILIALVNLKSGISNYQSYQDYFADSNLGEFSLTKLPFILGAGFFKFLFIGTVCRVFAFKRKINFTDVICILAMVVTTVLVALSRGTSFEFFEIIMTFVFAALMRRRRFRNENWFNKKSIVILGIVSFGIIVFFGYNISLRGDFSCTTAQFCYDKNGLLATISPFLGRISYQVSSYFVFGMYFTSAAINSIHLGSVSGLIAFFIPSGLTLFNLGDSYRSIVCDKVIDCGAAWQPDMILQIGTFGVIGLLSMVSYLGYLSTKMFKRMLEGSIFAAILLYFIFLYMISLPVGNFIASSSSNILAIFFSILFYFVPQTRRIFLGYFKINKTINK